jgi:thymidylate kinase
MTRRLIPGRLVILEGPDGVGKTTITHAVADHLLSKGHDVLQLSFPGKQPGTVGELVYRIHHDDGPLSIGNITPLAKQALHVAAHIDAIDGQILPALTEGKIVILDRFWWSVWVYGLVAGCSRHKLRALVEAERSVWGRVQPALAILLERTAPIERNDPLPYWHKLRDEYARLAAREKRFYPISIIENKGALAATLSTILPLLKPLASRAAQTAIQFDSEPYRRTHPVGDSHILPLKPSVVYDTYWRFAAERQETFFRRLEGRLRPWTSDPILAEYKFTNAYRASDRVSQYLIRRVIYRDDLPNTPEEVFFRIMLFKFFNKIETWDRLEQALGPLSFEEYSFDRYDKVLTRAMDDGAAIYSAAYIMPSGGRELGHDRKHRNHLVLLERMLADSVPQRLAESRSMQRAFELLKAYPSLGDFLAYQFVTDINYSDVTDFPESEFVVPGPGALDGIKKCFRDRGGLNDAEVIKFMTDRQEREFERLGIAFRSLWGRRLQLIDCQNLFCEVDKYARVGHPEIEGLSGRTRIKQRFDPKNTIPRPWYPPKWGLNEVIESWWRDRPGSESDGAVWIA